MKTTIAETIDLLGKLGFYYDKIADDFISDNYGTRLYLRAKECTDLVIVFNRVIAFERDMARHFAKGEVKAEILRWLKNE